MSRTLIKSATITSMDARLGDFLAGDLLIEADRIVDVRPNIELGSGAAETEIIDGTGRIVIPGLINAHMHTWQTALRGFAAVGLAAFDSAISLNVDTSVARSRS